MKTALCLSLWLAGAPAAAESATPGPPDSEGGAPLAHAPDGRVGSFQLLLQAPPLAADTLQVQRGFGFDHDVFGNSAGYFGLAAGLGYTLTELFEFGGALQFSYAGTGSAVSFELEPFVKANFGPSLRLGAINPFILGGLGLGVATAQVPTPAGAAKTTFATFTVDVEPGIEWLFGGRWGVDAYIPIQVELATFNRADVGLTFGVAYGLVGYL